MAAAAWKVYNEAKLYMLNGTLDLDTGNWRMALYKSTSNASTYTLSTGASVSNVVNAAGYTGAKTLTVSVRQSTSATIVWDCADVIFTASGADVTSIMYAVIYVSGGKAVAWSKLSTAIFSVTSGNTLTVQINSGGIFQLTGG
jgi:hypothetical protein